MALTTLDNLLLEELQDLYSAETQLLDALPQLADAASRSELEEAFNEHLDETREQIDRLEKVFDHLGQSTGNEHCDAMAGLIAEGEERIQENGKSDVKDAALISAAQRTEHYEIAAYGAARTYADQLGHSEVRDLLDETLSEEKNADKKLNRIATGGWLASGVNRDAA